MSLRTQAKLLKTIQECKFERLGGTRQVEVDVRIIAATTRDLILEIRNGRFMEDLYYRLNVVELSLPPLRDHLDDIQWLVPYFVSQFFRREGMEPKLFSADALEVFKDYLWPGNVRELKNVVERILIMSSVKVIGVEDVRSLFSGYSQGISSSAESASLVLPGTLREAREEFERDFIIQRLEENDWNISRTAEIIELERSNLHRKIKSYGIDVRR